MQYTASTYLQGDAVLQDMLAAIQGTERDERLIREVAAARLLRMQYLFRTDVGKYGSDAFMHEMLKGLGIFKHNARFI